MLTDKEKLEMSLSDLKIDFENLETDYKALKKELAEKQKEIIRLHAILRRMKCCTNCKHYISPVDMGDQTCEMCEDNDHWELKA